MSNTHNRAVEWNKYTQALLTEKQAQIERLRAEVERLRAALDWYAPNLADCNRYGNEGDHARQKLANDRGMRARDALTGKEAG